MFTFISITYNHEKYILEHLESIRYQIVNYGKGERFQLIIADDCSKDKTLEYIELWLEDNSALFDKVNVETDSANRGTCANYTKVWDIVEGERFKTLAGDDIYSCENLFEAYEGLEEREVREGLPLMLIDGAISISQSQIKHIIAADVIYKKKSFYDRIKSVGVFITPCMIFSNDLLTYDKVKLFVRRYHVIEDYPFLIAVGELDKDIVFKQLNQIQVYYRRTNNSTYLIKSDAFNTDRVSLYEYLVNSEQNSFDKMIQKNRLDCFRMKNGFAKKIFNISYYVYSFQYLCNYSKIRRETSNLRIDIIKHQNYFDMIRENAQKIIKEKCKGKNE